MRRLSSIGICHIGGLRYIRLFDIDAIKAAGFNTITPMLVCNSTDYGTFKTNVGKAVTNDDVVIELAK